jgi:hypothetical protein
VAATSLLQMTSQPGTGGDSLSAQAQSLLPTLWQTEPAMGSGSDEANEKHVVIALTGLAVLAIVVGILNVTVRVRGHEASV